MKTELDDFRRQTAERLRREEERLRERFEEGRRKGLAAEAVQTLFSEAPAFVEPEPGISGPLVVGEPVRDEEDQQVGADRRDGAADLTAEDQGEGRQRITDSPPARSAEPVRDRAAAGSDPASRSSAQAQ